MENKKRLFYIIVYSIILSNCIFSAVESISVHNKVGTIMTKNENYVIDSMNLYQMKFDSSTNTLKSKLILTIYLKEKNKGENKLNLYHLPPGYEYSINRKQNIFNCTKLGGEVIIKSKSYYKKGKNIPPNEKYRLVQRIFFDYYPCKDTIIKYEALKRPW